ncbi:hypothetical protein TrLO_g1349 [Triparma laevis f. longispina]|uniref:Uncharacterized protein n=1 Tax=Triparma laevis f. longispina TaxID=1714387 RepID=A0A9W7KY64_9STRA|nr:hypothetical protein TrLO_g1349 [Triparma laevis f. longispina]
MLLLLNTLLFFSLSFSKVTYRFVPLVGAPAFLPPLHQELVLFNDDPTDASNPHILDFLPDDADEPATIKSLVTFKSVPATIRFRSLPKPLPTSSAQPFVLDCARSPILQGEIDSFITNWKQKRPDLHLLSNNCYSFCVEFLSEIESRDPMKRSIK